MADSVSNYYETGDVESTQTQNRGSDSMKSNIKYEWYQTTRNLTVALLVKNMKPEQVKVKFHPNAFSATLEVGSGDTKSLEISLEHEIIPSDSTYRILSSKVEIKLMKRYGEKWSNLELTEAQKSINPVSANRNWDKVVETELKDDKAESEAALNELFQKIYNEGTDEVKKAMNKSFVESGGTVLSTNWTEVGKETVEIKPPDGLEWKKWDS